ncbi:MAG: hypothetical protein ACQETQ_01260 [Spirochaetota bacterium]
MIARGLSPQPARVGGPFSRRFAFVVLIVVTASSVLGAQELYRSNAAGMEIEPIEEAQRDDHDYVLEVREVDGERERSLYREEVIIRRERYLSSGRGRLVREERYDDGDLRYVRLYDERGRVEEERDYDEAGELSERVELEYRDGRRVRERHFEVDAEGDSADADDEDPTYTDEFEYDSEGRVRRVSRVRDGDVRRETRYAYAEGRLFEESFRNGEEVTVVRYDRSGRVAFRAERRGGDVVRRQEYRYEGDGERVVTTRDRNETGVRVERFAEGRLVSTRVEVDGEVISRSRREYEDGNLSRVVSEGRDLAGRRVEEYEYDENGELARRVVRVREKPVKEIVYRGKRSREETTYRDGEPFLRIRYRDGNPVSRELVAGE